MIFIAAYKYSHEKVGAIPSYWIEVLIYQLAVYDMHLRCSLLRHASTISIVQVGRSLRSTLRSGKSLADLGFGGSWRVVSSGKALAWSRTP